MELRLYKNSSEPNRVDKSNYLELLTTINGVFKQSTSIIDPIIIIEIDYSTLNNSVMIVDDENNIVEENSNPVIADLSSSYFNSNYAYIVELNRYYYIRDIISINDRLWQLTMHCDVLMSHKDEIYNIYGYVARNEFTFNPMLEDSERAFAKDTNVTYEELPNVNLTINTDYVDSDVTCSYVLTTIRI